MLLTTSYITWQAFARVVLTWVHMECGQCKHRCSHHLHHHNSFLNSTFQLVLSSSSPPQDHKSGGSVNQPGILLASEPTPSQTLPHTLPVPTVHPLPLLHFRSASHIFNCTNYKTPTCSIGPRGFGNGN